MKLLKFKKDNVFTNKIIDGEKFNKLCEKVKTDCILFTDVSSMPLFGLKKTALNTQKGFIYFINTIFKNYGIKIKSVQTSERDKNKKKIMNYSLVQEDFNIEEPLLTASEYYLKYGDEIKYSKKDKVNAETHYKAYLFDTKTK